MAAIGRYDNCSLAGHVEEIIITIDAAVVGTISPTGKGRYLVNTKGLIPAIDGVSGLSFDEAWSEVARRVLAGGVSLTRVIDAVSEKP